MEEINGGQVAVRSEESTAIIIQIKNQTNVSISRKQLESHLSKNRNEAVKELFFVKDISELNE